MTALEALRAADQRLLDLHDANADDETYRAALDAKIAAQDALNALLEPWDDDEAVAAFLDGLFDSASLEPCCARP